MRSCVSRSLNASNVSSATHFARAMYGAGTIPSRSSNSLKPSSLHLKDTRCPASTSVAATANIFPPTLNTRSAPHWICSVAAGKERQNLRSFSRFKLAQAEELPVR